MRIINTGLNSINEAGQYSVAAAQYSGLVIASLLMRSGSAIKEAGKYSCATMEFAGWASYNAIKRTGGVVKNSVSTVTTPVTRAVATPFKYISRQTGRLFGRKKAAAENESIPAMEARLALLEAAVSEERLRKIEAKLAELEIRRPRPDWAKASETRRGPVSKDKLPFLKAIFDENKTLRSES
ncbi:MAG: hypothetical protein HQK55_11050 [Deltaproteobacteria bacterium]|nr:hypothetical protein [Deltaproteobacteria bacterium]